MDHRDRHSRGSATLTHIPHGHSKHVFAESSSSGKQRWTEGNSLAQPTYGRRDGGSRERGGAGGVSHRGRYDPSAERGWTGGGGRGLVDDRVRRKRRREENIVSDRSQAAAAASGGTGDSAESTSRDAGSPAPDAAPSDSKVPRRRRAGMGAALSGRLMGALFKGQLQAAKQTLESKPEQERLAAQASARAAAAAKEAEATRSLMEAQRAQRTAQLNATQARKRVMEATVMASRWKAHYSTLAAGEYLATETEPALFWKPAKPNAASLKGLLQRRKHSQDAMAVQQPLWDEFVAQEKRAVASLLDSQAPAPQRIVVQSAPAGSSVAEAPAAEAARADPPRPPSTSARRGGGAEGMARPSAVQSDSEDGEIPEAHGDEEGSAPAIPGGNPSASSQATTAARQPAAQEQAMEGESEHAHATAAVHSTAPAPAAASPPQHRTPEDDDDEETSTGAGVDVAALLDDDEEDD